MSDDKNGFDGYTQNIIKQMNKFSRFANDINQISNPAIRTIEKVSAIPVTMIEPPAFREIQRSMDLLNSTIPNYLEQYNAILTTIPDTSIETMVGEFNRSYSKLLNTPLVRTIEEMNNLTQRITQFIPDIGSMLADTNWESFELTEEDQRKVQTILNSKDKESAISYELDKLQRTETTYGNWINIILLGTVLPLIFIILGYLTEQSGFISEELHSIAVSFMKTEELEFKIDTQKKKKPLKHIINDIIDRLKKEIPIFIQCFLGIVTRDNLIVRKENRVNSMIIGELEAKTIVQTIDQKKNWIYISYFDTKENMILEGWVFTRYIKKIK